MNKVLKGLVAVVSTAAMAIAGFAGAASATAADNYSITITPAKVGMCMRLIRFSLVTLTPVLVFLATSLGVLALIRTSSAMKASAP